MDAVLRYRGREITNEQVGFIRALMAQKPEASRRALSIELSRAWGWVQPNGALRDAICRGLLLALSRAGHIELPARRREFACVWARRTPLPVEIDTTPLEVRLRDLGPIEIRQVRRTPADGMVDSLVEHHHYLRYRQPVGEHLKHLVTVGERPIACFVWSSAPRHLGPRDRHIGWSTEVRTKNIRLVAYQTRFLILPWVRVPHLASHLLGRMARQLSADWQRVYAHPIHFTETFVDTERNRGTCYRAANWTELGLTTGRGKADLTHAPNRSLKRIFGYPLVPDYRERLATISS
jgi:hypothetical protein